VGTAITLQHLLESGQTLSEMKASLPSYFISKSKINLQDTDPDVIIKRLTDLYKNARMITDDGLKIDFDDHWVHFRKSNTEPIIRIITEAGTAGEAGELSKKYVAEIKKLSS
jgi:phosphomannomutase